MQMSERWGRLKLMQSKILKVSSVRLENKAQQKVAECFSKHHENLVTQHKDKAERV